MPRKKREEGEQVLFPLTVASIPGKIVKWMTFVFEVVLPISSAFIF
jgi:hypothetical protein